MSPMDLLKLFLLSEVVWIVAMFVGMFVTRVNFTIPRLLIIATVPTLVVVIPLPFFLKLIASTIVTYTLIVKLTDARLFPDAFLAVMVSNIAYVLLGIWIVARFT